MTHWKLQSHLQIYKEGNGECERHDCFINKPPKQIDNAKLHKRAGNGSFFFEMVKLAKQASSPPTLRCVTFQKVRGNTPTAAVHVSTFVEQHHY